MVLMMVVVTHANTTLDFLDSEKLVIKFKKDFGDSL